MRKRFSKKPITSFQRKVYEVVKKIPKGEILSYQQVARLTGHPKACRAVGNALNKNPDSKIIPCHRVVKSDGKIGGYRTGQKKKIRLLRKEGVVIKNRSCLTKK